MENIKEPWTSQYIENVHQRHGATPQRVRQKILNHKSFRDIIQFSFAWTCTPQGFFYWEEIASN